MQRGRSYDCRLSGEPGLLYSSPEINSADRLFSIADPTTLTKSIAASVQTTAAATAVAAARAVGMFGERVSSDTGLTKKV